MAWSRQREGPEGTGKMSAATRSEALVARIEDESQQGRYQSYMAATVGRESILARCAKFERKDERAEYIEILSTSDPVILCH
jgi:hypothetical protein